MTGPTETPVARLLHLLRSHAAQSGPFRPVEAIRAAGPEAAADPLVLAEALSKLHGECSVTPGPAGDLWLYRPEMRRKMQTQSPPGPQTVAAAPDRAIADAQAGRGDFAPATLRRLIATATDPDRLADLAVTLERAGPQAPGQGLLVALRSALNAARDRSRSDGLLAAGFFGREAELSALSDWIARLAAGLPLRALLVSGPPGIGKTLLLERAVLLARNSRDPVLVRLDFERPALGAGEDGALLEEISRQVADSLPKAAEPLRALRLAAAAERGLVERGSGRRYLPRDLLAGIVREVRRAGRPVLIILDTLDLLQGRGATFPDTLMASFDRMVEAGLPEPAILAAGRGPVFPEPGARVGLHLPLAGLDDAGARQMLAARGVAERRWPRLLVAAAGNPLVLSLAAGGAAGPGPGRARPKGIAARVAGAYLQRAILGRLPEDLGPAALASLMLPRIDAAILRDVIAPALGPERDPEAAVGVLAALAGQPWLAVRDGAALVFRPEMRAALAVAIGVARPDLATAVMRRAAARSGADTGGDASPRLRSPAGPPASRSAPGGLWLRLDPGREGRLIALSGSSGDGGTDLPGFLNEIEAALAAGAVEESAHLLARGLTGPFAADSTPGRLVLAQVWLTGRWAQARRLLAAQPAQALPAALAESPHLVGRVMLEVWAEFRFAHLRRALRDPGLRALADRALTGAGRIALRGGALDFAVIAQSGRDLPPAGVEEAMGVLAPRLHGLPLARALAARAAADTLRKGFGLSYAVGGPGSQVEPPWEAGGRIAPLNPYDGPLKALVGLHDRQGGTVLTRRLAALAPVLPELAGLFAPGVRKAGDLPGRVTAHVPGLVDALGALGLTAEWSGGLAAVTRQSDLGLIARAAERWRRTVCGVWSYPGRAPPGWAGIALPDWGSRHLADHLAAGTDPETRAKRALAIWSAADPAAAARRPRVPRATVVPPDSLLATLLRQGHPSSVAVPLALLAAPPPVALSPAKPVNR